MHRRPPERSRGLHLPVGPRDFVVQAEHLGDPVVQPAVVAVERREAADVDAGEVAGGCAVDDPLRQRPARTARGGDAHRVESGADEEVVELGRLAEDELVVGGEALRAVVELLDAGHLERGDAQQRVVHQDLEVVPILFQQLEFERVRDVVGRHPRLGLRLEAADDEAADLFLEVRVAVGVAQDRQVGVHTVDVLGDHVEVLGRMQRHVDACHRADLFGPLPGAVDDDLGLDVALVGAHTGGAPVVGENAGGPGLFDDAGAAHPRALGERERQVGRVGLAVGGQPDGADQVVDPHDGIVLERLLGGQQFAFHVERRGVGRGAAQLDHPVLGAGDGDSPALLVPGGQSGLVLEFGIELGGVLHQPGLALRCPQLADQTGGVPGGAAGQLALLEQHDVGEAELGQVVGDAGADHAAADDDDLGAVGQLGGHQSSACTSSSSRARFGPLNSATAPS